MIQETVEELMRRGWQIRSGAKHWKIYSPDGKDMQTIPGSPSDGRSELNFRADVRRILKRRGEYVNSFNSPKIITPATPTSKPLSELLPEKDKNQARYADDPDFIPHVCELIRLGKSITDIISLCEKAGYVGRLSRKPITANGLRYMLWQKRISVREMQGKPPMKKSKVKGAVKDGEILKDSVTYAKSKEAPESRHPLLHEVLEIVSSNLSEDKKEKFLLSVAREFVQESV
jgi:hypothetical protein